MAGNNNKVSALKSAAVTYGKAKAAWMIDRNGHAAAYMETLAALETAAWNYAGPAVAALTTMPARELQRGDVFCWKSDRTHGRSERFTFVGATDQGLGVYDSGTDEYDTDPTRYCIESGSPAWDTPVMLIERKTT